MWEIFIRGFEIVALWGDEEITDLFKSRLPMISQIKNRQNIVRKRLKTLLVISTIYGVLYLIAFGPDLAYSGLSIPSMLFLFFLVGYLLIWKHEGIGGAVFILWYVGWWILRPILIDSEYRDAFYLGVILGIPLLIIGILFVVRWYRGRATKEPQQA